MWYTLNLAVMTPLNLNHFEKHQLTGTFFLTGTFVKESFTFVAIFLDMKIPGGKILSTFPVPSILNSIEACKQYRKPDGNITSSKLTYSKRK